MTCGSAGTCVPDTPGPPPAGPPMGAPCNGTCLDTTCVAFIGNGASGGQCQHTSGLACISDTCRPLLSQGQTCSTQFQCADPLVCNGIMCAPRLPDGSPCSPPSADNTCLVGSGCVSGVCTVLKASGQSCTDPSECLGNRCVAGLCVPMFGYPICGA
jgi:hypothetical protein